MPKINLRERNEKVLAHTLMECEEIKTFRGQMKDRYGMDPMKESDKFPVMNPDWSWKTLNKKLALKEADTSSAFTQFLRAGIQTITNSMYQSVSTTFEDWVHVIQSSKDTELYAPNQGIGFPTQVGPSTLYPELGAAALDISLKNLKFGSIYAVEKELLNDDQTGSFQQQNSYLGEYMKLLAEVLCYGKLASVSGMKYINYSIPTTETKPTTESTYPWNSTGFVGGGGKTRPSSYTILTQAAIQTGIIALMNQVNLQGIKMMVNPNRIIIGPAQSFDASVLLNSAYYPSGAASAGSTGGAFAINPIKGIADLTVSRFVAKNDGTFNGDSKAWYLVDDSKPWFVLQMREAVTIEVENPNSGASFNLDHYRIKGRCRMNADFLDPRFAWQGNDGSVTS